MLRRHATPALFIFTPALICCLLRPLQVHYWWIAGAFALALCALAAIMLFAFRASSRDVSLALALSLGFAFGALCLTRMSSQARRSFLPISQSDITGFRLSLSRDSVLTEKGETHLSGALFEASSTKRGFSAAARGGVLLIVPGDYRFSMGEKLEVRASLDAFDSQSGSESYVAWAGRSDIRRLGYSSRAWDIRSRAREWIALALARLGYPASALLEALVLGSREDVPPDLADAFRRTGSLHVLALSGLHAGIVYSFAFAFLGFLRGRKTKLGVGIALLAAYQLLAGPIPSLLRATLMLAAGGIRMVLDRDSESINILAIAGIAMLAIDPYQAASLSFQLSFLALGGILVLGPIVRRPLAGRIPPFLLEPLCASIGAQLATLPIVVQRFGWYYPSGIIASVLLVPLTAIFLWLGLGWILVFPLLPDLARDLCARAFAGFYALIDACATVLSRLPGISFAQPSASWIAAVFGTVAIAMAVLLPPRRGKPLPGAIP